MGGFVKGDIVVINFPFSDLSSAKRRPAFVLSSLEGDDIILCQITTRHNSDKYAIAIEQGDYDEGELSAKSVVRPNKLFTADKNLILYAACKLKKEKVEQVISKLTDILNS